MNDLQFYKKWLEIVRKSKRWGAYENWSNYEFSKLSEEISEKSNIKLSRTTIKNIIERNIIDETGYNPQTPTKDALAQYINYPNWESFKKKELQKRKRPVKIVALGGLFCTIVLVVFWFFFHEEKLDYTFKLENAVGITPHTLTCKYDVSKLKTNDVLLDFGHLGHHGDYLYKNLSKEKHFTNQIFHFPGIYKTRLFIDEQIMAEEDVVVYSKDWFIYATEAKINYECPKIIQESGVFFKDHIRFDAYLKRTVNDKGYFYVSTEQITEIDDLSPNYNVVLLNYKDFNIPVSDCAFSCRFKNTSINDASYCNEAIFTLQGSKHLETFAFAIKGCEYYARYRIGPDLIKGSDITEDLGFLILDFSEFNTIKIEHQGKTIKVYINNNLVKTISHSHELGDLLGLRLQFKGSPQIDFVTLTNSAGELIYNDEFTK